MFELQLGVKLSEKCNEHQLHIKIKYKWGWEEWKKEQRISKKFLCVPNADTDCSENQRKIITSNQRTRFQQLANKMYQQLPSSRRHFFIFHFFQIHEVIIMTKEKLMTIEEIHEMKKANLPSWQLELLNMMEAAKK